MSTTARGVSRAPLIVALTRQIQTALAVLLVASACAPVLPRDPVQRALVRDLARVVQSRAQISWFVDDLEVPEVLSDGLDSTCRVEPRKRLETLIWLNGEIARLGGPVEDAYERAGRDFDEIEDLLLWHRTRMVLRASMDWAQRGKCPFWLEVEPEFRGRQDYNRKFFLASEAGGRFYTQWEDGHLGFGGGGAARLLFGYGVSDESTIISGIEFGGSGRFTDVQFGERVEVPAFIIVGAVPVILRKHELSTYYDVEVGALAYTNQLRGRTQFGARVGAGIGFMRTRLTGFLPGITASMNYDYVPGRGLEPTVHQIGIGLRGVFALTF